MTFSVQYIEDNGAGNIAVDSTEPIWAWNDLRDFVLRYEPGATLRSVSLRASWSTVLLALPLIVRLRREGIAELAFHDEVTESLVRRHAVELREVRRAAGGLQIRVLEEEVQGRLEEVGFTRVLRDHQINAVSRLASISHGANFSVPGAGKTTVALAVHALAVQGAARMLVVAPRNAFVAWDEAIDECYQAASDESTALGFVRLQEGADAIRQQLRAAPRRMLMTYDQLIRVPGVVRSLLSSTPVHLVLDESHRMKAGAGSQRGSALLSLAHLAARRDILSGTPIPKAISDLTPQIDFLWPGTDLGTAVAEHASPSEALGPLYVRVTKAQLGLPQPERHFVSVMMSQAQSVLYALIRVQVIARLRGIRRGGVSDLMAARKSVMRLLQASSNPLLVVKAISAGDAEGLDHEDPSIRAIFRALVEERDSPKLERACSMARQFASEGRKTVIWSAFIGSVERIAEKLEDLNAQFIHGGVPVGDVSDPQTREAKIRAFHDDASGCMVLVANPAACSEGISLHRTCHDAVYVDRTYNAAHYLQSVDRIHRLGLPEGVTTRIHVLESLAPDFAGSIDYSVRRRLVEKLRVMASTLNDEDLRLLAIDEDDAEAPILHDIDLQDLLDALAELEELADVVPDEDEF